eukprot:386002-Amphidinium_carterae.1
MHEDCMIVIDIQEECFGPLWKRIVWVLVEFKHCPNQIIKEWKAAQHRTQGNGDMCKKSGSESMVHWRNDKPPHTRAYETKYERFPRSVRCRRI